MKKSNKQNLPSEHMQIKPTRENGMKKIIAIILLLFLPIFVFAADETSSFTIIKADDTSGTAKSIINTVPGENVEIGVLEPEIMNGRAKTICGYSLSKGIVNFNGWIICADPAKYYIYLKEKDGSVFIGVPGNEIILKDGRKKATWSADVPFIKLGENSLHIYPVTNSNERRVAGDGDKINVCVAGTRIPKDGYVSSPHMYIKIHLYDNKGKEISSLFSQGEDLFPKDKHVNISKLYLAPSGTRVKITYPDGSPDNDFLMGELNSNDNSKISVLNDWTVPEGKNAFVLTLKEKYTARLYEPFYGTVESPGFKHGMMEVKNGNEPGNEGFKKVWSSDKPFDGGEFGNLLCLMELPENFAGSHYTYRVLLSDNFLGFKNMEVDRGVFAGAQACYTEPGFSIIGINVFEPFGRFSANIPDNWFDGRAFVNMYAMGDMPEIEKNFHGYKIMGPVYRVKLYDSPEINKQTESRHKITIKYLLNDINLIQPDMDKIFDNNPKDNNYSVYIDFEKEIIAENSGFYKTSRGQDGKIILEMLPSKSNRYDNVVTAEVSDIAGDYIVLPANSAPFIKDKPYAEHFVITPDNSGDAVISVRYAPMTFSSKYILPELDIHPGNDVKNPVTKIIDKEGVKLDYNPISEIKRTDIATGKDKTVYFYSKTYRNEVITPFKWVRDKDNGAGIQEGVCSAKIIINDVFGNSTASKFDFIVSKDEPGINISLAVNSKESANPVIKGEIVLPEKYGDCKIGYRTSEYFDDTGGENIWDGYQFIMDTISGKTCELENGLRKYKGSLVQWDTSSVPAGCYDVSAFIVDDSGKTLDVYTIQGVTVTARDFSILKNPNSKDSDSITSFTDKGKTGHPNATKTVKPVFVKQVAINTPAGTNTMTPVFTATETAATTQNAGMSVKYLKQWSKWGVAPYGISVDEKTGQVYEAAFCQIDDDESYYKIEVFDSDGNGITEWKCDSTGVGVDCITGRVYTLNFVKSGVGVYDLKGNYITQLADYNGGSIFFSYGASVDNKTGNVYVVNYGYGSIVEFDKNGKFIREWGKKDGTVSLPSGISVDDERGRVYVADKNKIVLFRLDGTYISEWNCKNREDGAFGISVDKKNGRVFAADTYGNTVKVFDADGKYVTEFGGTGTKAGEMIQPHDLCVDSTTEKVYVADTGNRRIDVFQIVN